MAAQDTSSRDVTLLIEARDAASSGRGTRLRQAAGISQGEFARALGVTPSCVCRWEAGKRRPRGEIAPAYVQMLRMLAGRVAHGGPNNGEDPADNRVSAKERDDGAHHGP